MRFFGSPNVVISENHRLSDLDRHQLRQRNPDDLEYGSFVTAIPRKHVEIFDSAIRLMLNGALKEIVLTKYTDGEETDDSTVGFRQMVALNADLNQHRLYVPYLAGPYFEQLHEPLLQKADELHAYTIGMTNEGLAALGSVYRLSPLE